MSGWFKLATHNYVSRRSDFESHTTGSIARAGNHSDSAKALPAISGLFRLRGMRAAGGGIATLGQFVP